MWSVSLSGWRRVMWGVCWLLVAFACASVGEQAPRPKPLRVGSLTHATLAFAWPEYPGRLNVTDPAVLARISQAVAYASREPAEVASDPTEQTPVVALNDARHVYYRLRLLGSKNETRTFALTRQGQMYDAARLQRLVNPDLDRILQELIAQLNKQMFGKPVPWHKALGRFPVGHRARVRDLETGLSFQIYRHRGDAHTDVEPLTAHDAAILKQIFGGEWSWKRRAVVVEADGSPIAGSMNGMPHGWGDIFDNEFVGHFCIHYQGSRVHSTWRPDPGHQLMVLKAAGTLAETLEAAEPAELADWVLAALNNYETATLRHASVEPPSEAWQTQARRLIRHLAVHHVGRAEYDGDGTRGSATFGTAASGQAPSIADEAPNVDKATSATVMVRVAAYYFEPDPDTPHLFDLAVRFTKGERWLVDLTSLDPLFNRAGQPDRPVRTDTPDGLGPAPGCW